MPKRKLSFSAPFAGRLAELISAQAEQKIVKTLEDALSAMTTIRSPRPEDTSRNNYLLVEDWGARVCAAKILWEMRDGKPRQAIDMSLQSTVRPMTRLEAEKELLESWEDVRRIGDEHVRLLQQVIPRLASGNVTEIAVDESVDVDLPE